MSRSVVVTGAGQGIGLGIAERLVAEGWFVVGVDRDAQLLSDLSARMDERVVALHGDVTTPDTFERAVAAALTRGPLLGWVNNAGIVRRSTLLQATRRDVQETLGVNLEGTFWGCVQAVRTFVDQQSGGAIVNISSIHGRQSAPEHAAYEMSKGGIDALTRNLAVEYGAHGIRVNAVAPGVIRTQILDRSLAEADDGPAMEKVLAGVPALRRIGKASEIAAVVSFLLSPDASYLTGQSIAVDGGWTAGLLPAADQDDASDPGAGAADADR